MTAICHHNMVDVGDELICEWIQMFPLTVRRQNSTLSIFYNKCSGGVLIKDLEFSNVLLMKKVQHVSIGLCIICTITREQYNYTCLLLA